MKIVAKLTKRWNFVNFGTTTLRRQGRGRRGFWHDGDADDEAVIASRSRRTQKIRYILSKRKCLLMIQNWQKGEKVKKCVNKRCLVMFVSMCGTEWCIGVEWFGVWVLAMSI